MMVARRQFFKLVGGAMAASGMPHVLREALAIPANNATGTIADVKHIVVLMQENRSFDHYFGTFPGVRGFADRFPLPLASGKPVWYQKPRPPEINEVIPYHLDSSKGNAQRVTGTPHSWIDMHFAWADGRTGAWPAFKETQSMGFYREKELPFQFALANAFTLCDHYHNAILSSTNPNRLFLFTGTNNPSGIGGGPAIDNTNDDLGPSSSGYAWITYAERLEKAGVSWKVYQDMADNFTDNSLEGFVNFRKAEENKAKDPNNPLLLRGLTTTLGKNSLDGLKRDVMNRSLPTISYVVGPAEYLEHTGPSSPVQGAWYTQQVIEALISDPDTWSKTILIVNFDENDGFFDHVPPPCAPSLNPDGSLAGASTVDDSTERRNVNHQVFDQGWVYGPGTRVPCWVVSPWSRGGWVNSQTFDHTSVVQLMELVTGVREPNISAWRRAFCGNFLSAFDFKNPNSNAFPTLPAFTKSEADNLRKSQEQLPQVPATADALPKQEKGLRKSRALPYENHVAISFPTPLSVEMAFHNTGTMGAVFHVYDMNNLTAVPRRYAVEPCKSLTGQWLTASQGGAYDYFILGTSGFHRRYSGSSIEPGTTGQIVAELCYDAGLGDAIVSLFNAGNSDVTVSITDNAYGVKPKTLTVKAGQSAELAWALKDSLGWYDLSVTQAGTSSFLRRFAGRVETGRDGFSDPALA